MEKKICRFIKVKRQERGLTVEQFSAEVGVEPMIVRQWENGVVPPTEFLLAIAKVLNVDVEELLRGSDEPTENQEPQAEESEPARLVDVGENCKPKKEELAQKQKSKEAENFEILTRKPTESDRLADAKEPSGKNGFYKLERYLACFLCFGFLFVIIIHYISSGIAFATRDRKLTLENYQEYFSVKVEVETTNGMVLDPETFYVYVEPKDGMREIYNFNLTVKVTMPYSLGGEYVGDVSFTTEKFTDTFPLKESVTSTKAFGFWGKAKVIAVSGDIA